jgi:glycosyltransferase involved in cell wall biosynthesis
VLYVGRLDTNQKQIELLAKIVKEVIAKNTDIKFHIVGDGEGKNIVVELEKENKKNVKYLGTINDIKLKHEYNIANLFLFPSKWEDFGISLLEAQSRGIPAIAFNVRGPREIIKTHTQGTLIKPFEYKRMENEIINRYYSWKTNRKKYLEDKNKISKIAFKKWGIETIMPKLIDMFTSIVK